jgi:hypothetical protein
MPIVGIETRATIPSKNLEQFEKEIFSLGFEGSLLAGVGLFPNGIILRSEKQEDDPQTITLEFSYPPFDIQNEEICQNVCNQYSAFFHLIKQYGGNPYPWYINLRETELEINGYKNLKAVKGVAICSINPFHLTTRRSNVYYYWLHFIPFSLGEVDFAHALDGPLLSFKYESENSKKEIDLREFAKEFVFSKKIMFGVRVNQDESLRADGYKHFSLIALPHDVLLGIKSLDEEELKSLGEKIVSAFFTSDSKNESFFIPVEDPILEKVESELENLEKDLPEDSIEKIPVREIISNRNEFKDMAENYLEEKWGVKNNSLTNAYSLLLAEVDYVERIVKDGDKRLYDVTNFPVVKYKEDWFTEFTKRYRVNIHHNLSNSVVNYNIEIQEPLDLNLILKAKNHTN